MITITSVHLFKIRNRSIGSWRNAVHDMLGALINIVGHDSEKEKELEREIRLAEQGHIEKSNKYVHEDDHGYSLSYGQLMAAVTDDSVKAYYAAPNSMDGWGNKINNAFALEKLPQLHMLADSGLVDLVVMGKRVYGHPDWVYVFLKNTSAFYGFDSLVDVYEQLRGDKLIAEFEPKACIEAMNTLFSKRKFF